MKPGLDPGVAHETQVVVTAEMCPHFDGAMLHPVLATWTLVHQFEVAGRKLLEPHLEQHEEGIGAHISVDHESPAWLGSLVRFRAEVESCEAHRLTTRMTAFVGERQIASGRMVQAILPRTKLAAIFEKHRPAGG